jgi:acyl transferase domain-containing protein/acyl-CoA synthetase (AMP-forming)/AMP-acid ligase II/thioesterase domain-containing protein
MLPFLDGGLLPSSVWTPRTVGEILIRAAELNRGRIVFPNATITYRELLSSAKPLKRGEPVALTMTEPETFLPALWSCFVSGAIPVVGRRELALPDIGDDVALLMQTSGSTGSPKVVALTHRNIITSVAASAFVNDYNADDVSLNWLPLWHIGALMRSIREVYVGCTQVQVPTSVVREDPLRWLDLIDEHRATIAWGTNTAFGSVVAQRHELSARRRWSLDCVRSFYSSGEPAMPRTMDAFAELLAQYGLRRDALRVAWGMTEACFATSSDSFDDVGTPVPGVAMRISDGDRLEISGPLVAADGWFDTGDLARIESGRLIITGRSKDVIRIGGVSYANGDIEEIAGVDPVAACSVTIGDGEALAIFGDITDGEIPLVRARIAEKFGITPRFVIPRKEFPRTDVGKINRRALRESFDASTYARWPFDLFAGAASAQDIAAILSDVLRVPVGVDDNFFALGGTSLRVAQAASRIGCTLADLFSAPTANALAARIGCAPHPPPRTFSGREKDETAIAIVGMSCRFPGAPDVESFWRLLISGQDALTRFANAASSDDPAYVHAGMIIDDIDKFDAAFFGLSARDAEIMDPQQRLLLECAWHALEDAGQIAGAQRTGVWVGARHSEYMLFHMSPPDLFGSPVDGFQRLVLNDKDYLATRIAHLLDCRGPAISVQTACSSSLVAVHMACRSLASGECDLALAGGASLRVPQEAGYVHSEGMIFSRDGHTRPFDADASGTIFGSGVGVVALRRLDDAVRDGDTIYAVIRGSAVNNDGAGPKASFTSPGHDGQLRVIGEALAAAGVDASSISYVEAHGTGTAVGDPIEIAALSAHITQPCAIGSVKSNIGHLVQAAGVAGLMKTALMLRHRTLVPTANFRKLNPLIGESPFVVNTETREWQGETLRAGVSAFGFGGTNAHVIVEQAPAPQTDSVATGQRHLLPISAKDPDALHELIDAYAHSDAPLRDLCASAQNGRAHFAHRVAIVASSHDELREKLQSATIEHATTRPRIAFVFSGQLFASDDDRTDIAQPAIVEEHAKQFERWREWGIEPDVVIGHSVGEISAAWAAGVITLDDALRFATARGRLMQSAEPGQMATVFAATAQQVAAINGSHQMVISGSNALIEDALAEFRTRGIATRRMPGRFAFHSPLMEPILDELEREASRMSISRPRLPLISTLTGTIADADFATPSYWRRQARQPVQYLRAIEAANAEIVVQLGPGADMLSTLALLYTRGVDVNWRAVETEPWRRVALPKYPFRRTRHWITTRRRDAPARDEHPLLGSRIPSPLAETQFQSELTVNVAPFTRDHWIYGVRPLVMVGHLEMMRAAAGATSVDVENVVVEQPLLLSEEPRHVQTLLAPDGTVRIFSSSDRKSWELHSRAHVQATSRQAPRIDLDAIRARCTTPADPYARKAEKGAAVGDGVKLVRRAWRGKGEVLAEVVLDDEGRAHAARYGAYPSMLDAFPQLGDLTLDETTPLFLPTVVDRVTFYDKLPERVWTTLRRRGDASGDVYGVDGEIADDSGRVLIAIEGFYFKRASESALTRADTMYEVDWVASNKPRIAGDGVRIVAREGECAEELCGHALDVVKSMLDENRDGPLWLIARHAQTTGRETAPLNPDHAALWGFGRALQREQPQLRCRLIDVDVDQGDPWFSDEPEVVVRGGVAYTKRLRRVRPPAPEPVTRREPQRGEVEIEVYCTGLNFRDVLNSTGRLDGPLGYECSGVIARSTVPQFKAGDAVMALAMNSLASHVTVDARLVIAKPRHLTFAAAASTLVASITARYALVDRAKLQRGERVLIHTAAGGVGHAAVQLAHTLGATVVASASRGKWDLVRAMGVDEIIDSRTPGFKADVDVILNTLGNDFIDDNIAALRPGGRVIELGHPKMLDLERTAKLAAAKDIDFINFHIAQDVDPDTIQQLLRQVTHAIPYRTFPVADTREAFETMLRGAHAGKLVLVHAAAQNALLELDPDGTYLVSGGSGAVGSRIVRWLRERGAKHVVSLSRREGFDITSSDLPDENVRGVIHAAGVLDDGVVAQQTRERFERVLSPKIAGARNLDRLRNLDFFVVISSVAGLWGNAGQTSYAAANAYLDQFIHARRQRGLPATSIDYGGWAGAGMAAGLNKQTLDPEHAIRALEWALTNDRPQIAVFEGAPPSLAEPAKERVISAAPRSFDDALERTRRHVVALCGGASIDVDRPLPELGLDSLTVLLLRGRLIAEFGDAAALPVIRFLEGRTVAELAKMTYERAAQAKRASSLTPIKPAGRAMPIFLVPPAARTAMIYDALAQSVHGDHPIYGLTPLGLDGTSEPHTSVDAMVAHYIDEIRTIAPNGPYLLGGTCFGGHVAWEMARQLSKSGTEVPLLILFDASPPLMHAKPSVAHKLRYAVQRVRHHVRHRTLARMLRNRLPNVEHRHVVDIETSETFRRVFGAHATASSAYQAGALTGNVLLLESEEFHDLLFHDRWRSMLRGKLETVIFPGTTHMQILEESNAAILGAELTRRLASMKL